MTANVNKCLANITWKQSSWQRVAALGKLTVPRLRWRLTSSAYSCHWSLQPGARHRTRCTGYQVRQTRDTYPDAMHLLEIALPLSGYLPNNIATEWGVAPETGFTYPGLLQFGETSRTVQARTQKIDKEEGRISPTVRVINGSRIFLKVRYSFKKLFRAIADI